MYFIGNVEGATDEPKVGVVLASAVTTRAQSKENDKPFRALKVSKQLDLEMTREELSKAQREDDSLKKAFKGAEEQTVVNFDKGGKARYEVKKGVLKRIYTSETGREVKQVMVPRPLRQQVISLAHDSILTGHLGVSKTADRILSEFFWPGITSEVTRYCRSCGICQRTIPKGRVSKAPLQKMPVIDEPFRRIAIDIIGPIVPASEKGNRFVLTVVDYATRYPEAIALPSIEAERVAESLLQIYSRVGIPQEILTDQGSNFMSEVMKEVSRLLSIRHLTSSPYHPQCNGLVEKFNGTLKHMMKKLCTEKPKDWDRYLNAVLFAYREVPSESLQFSPFELLYGRSVRGPMTILRELWTKENTESEVKTTYQYVVDLRSRIEETCKLAQENLVTAQRKAKKHFDKKARMRRLDVDDQALILLPTDNNKLIMQWKGPYKIVDRVGATDYKVDYNGKVKVFHINMLKKYFCRDDEKHTKKKEDDSLADKSTTYAAAAILHESDVEYEEASRGSMTLDVRNETVESVKINPELTEGQATMLREVLHEYGDVFSDKPGKTHLAEHKVVLTSTDPIRMRPYPVPFNMRESVDQEIQEMLKMGIIEPSESPYASPLHLVKKKDGSYRPVVDFRRLNKITVFDTEPMPDSEEIFAKLARAKWLSKLDFTKGYWQIPMQEADKPKTAFSSSSGTFQFTRMPFGMVNSGAAYNRMMRKLLCNVKNVDSFVDDVLIHTETFEEHLSTVRTVLERVREANLTVKPSKCTFGMPSLDFVGHHVGCESLKVMPDKVEQVLKAERPHNKTQVRAFLGLSGYYRKFVPNYSAIAGPLTDATKKGAPAEIAWDEPQSKAFETLKGCLSRAPILRLPNWKEPFTVRTDASDTGLGAVLLQESHKLLCPVAYISRKLMPRERNYSTVEKECLAVVWAIDKFKRYLYGREFTLQTDHQPLMYMDRARMTNARVMRWALALQPYRYRLESIAGKDNVGADFLSRSAED